MIPAKRREMPSPPAADGPASDPDAARVACGPGRRCDVGPGASAAAGGGTCSVGGFVDSGRFEGGPHILLDQHWI